MLFFIVIIYSILVGNKCDFESSREVQQYEGQQLGMIYEIDI